MLESLDVGALSAIEALTVIAAGFAAGAINAAVGSGSLITFPTLLAVGYPPVVANVSNTLGLVPGSVAGAWGYRRELRTVWPQVAPLLWASTSGAVLGAVLLVTFPAAFEDVVPLLVGLAVVLVLVQPWVAARAKARRQARSAPSQVSRTVGPGLWVGVLLAGVYGGYFGAAQGVLLIGILGLGLAMASLQQVNAVKNVLVGGANLASGLVYVFWAPVAWEAVALVAAGAIAGGALGADVARRMPTQMLRGIVVAVGIIALIMVLTS